MDIPLGILTLIVLIIGLGLFQEKYRMNQHLKKLYEYTIDRQEILNLLGERLALLVKELDPDKRYILALPSDINENDFEVAYKVLSDHLDLKNSRTHIVIMHGDVTMVEFS